MAAFTKKKEEIKKETEARLHAEGKTLEDAITNRMGEEDLRMEREEREEKIKKIRDRM